MSGKKTWKQRIAEEKKSEIKISARHSPRMINGPSLMLLLNINPEVTQVHPYTNTLHYTFWDRIIF